MALDTQILSENSEISEIERRTNDLDPSVRSEHKRSIYDSNKSCDQTIPRNMLQMYYFREMKGSLTPDKILNDPQYNLLGDLYCTKHCPEPCRDIIEAQNRVSKYSTPQQVEFVRDFFRKNNN